LNAPVNMHQPVSVTVFTPAAVLVLRRSLLCSGQKASLGVRLLRSGVSAGTVEVSSSGEETGTKLVLVTFSALAIRQRLLSLFSESVSEYDMRKGLDGRSVFDTDR